MKLAKGNLLMVSGIWHILVHVAYQNQKVYLHCICDHANNIHSFEPSEVEHWIDSKRIGWEHFDFHGRDCPHDVIAEVALGVHDDRFDHWLESDMESKKE